ncbi:MAG: hypothetical protein NTX50_29675 [Candidatus Sumerlaeota bacterium]|nr:hypothetical protein [Candidatus Sumerlaeota bacterium]
MSTVTKEKILAAFSAAMPRKPQTNQSVYYQILEIFGEALQNFLGENVRVSIMPNHVTSLGQEYVLSLTRLDKSYHQTLLRLYVKEGAKECHLDLYDKKGPVSISNPDSLEKTLHTFLKKPNVIESLSCLKAA